MGEGTNHASTVDHEEGAIGESDELAHGTRVSHLVVRLVRHRAAYKESEPGQHRAKKYSPLTGSGVSLWQSSLARFSHTFPPGEWYVPHSRSDRALVPPQNRRVGVYLRKVSATRVGV